MTGGSVCRMHGGAAGQTRRAASERRVMAAIEQEMAKAEERLARERLDWWTNRIVWLAEVTGEDPAWLTRQAAVPVVRGMLGLLIPFGSDWPVGLREEDEPQLRFKPVPRC
jgi:hypothetical protein